MGTLCDVAPLILTMIVQCATSFIFFLFCNTVLSVMLINEQLLTHSLLTCAGGMCSSIGAMVLS